MRTVLLYNKSNEYGLQQDVKVLEKVLKGSVRVADPLEPPFTCDLAIHFEVPYYGWMPWAKKNIFVMNPEWWEEAWNPYVLKADALIFKCAADRDYFVNRLPFVPTTYVIPWISLEFPQVSTATKPGFLWLLGASRNKREAASHILPLWQASWPPLTVFTTSPLAVESNASIHIENLDVDARRKLQLSYAGHLIFSAAESMGISAMEGLSAGAFLIGNALPTYEEAYGGEYVCLTPTSLEPFKGGRKDTFANLTSDMLEGCIEKFKAANLDACRTEQRRRFAEKVAAFSKAVEQVVYAESSSRILPPILPIDECPFISIITLLHNRRKFVDLAFHNLLSTDYPNDKIEWVVIEDSDDLNEQASDKIIKFGSQSPITVSYIPLQKVISIGEKRNMAIARAKHDIILMMDDDDHYPPTSFRRRVAWLSHDWNPDAVVCTTIACYDLVKGTSAVNTPPWSIGLSQRVSEATLTFKKSFWLARPFPSVSVAEGEEFLQGREGSVLEIPPQQIIVAMSHGKNATGRRIPPAAEPSCFWGFPKEFLIFLHRLAGVELGE